MAATARLTVLLEPAEKAVIQSHARAARISTGEYVKRAVTAYDTFTELDAETMIQLEAYLVLLDSSTKKMSAQIDAMTTKIDHSLDPTREAEMRARAEQEICDLDLSGIIKIFGTQT